MSKIGLATVWLDGCSGCHMSFLDIDERLITLAEKADLVYSPLVDTKEFPEPVDVFVPGCPPSADVIWYLITELLEGRQPELSAKTRFGA